MSLLSNESSIPTREGSMLPCRGYQQITNLASATALTVPPGTTGAWLQAEASDVRFRADGVDPTATVGFVIGASGDLWYPATPAHLGALKFIQAAPGAVLNVLYY